MDSHVAGTPTVRSTQGLTAGDQGDLLRKIHEFGLELTSLSATADLHERISRMLTSLTGAGLVTMGEYDPVRRGIVLKRVDSDSTVLGAMKQLLGFDVRELVSPLSDADYARIVGERVAVHHSLTGVSFGAIPRAVSILFQRLTGFDTFIGLAFANEGVLAGTAVLGFRKGVDHPPELLLDAFASITAISLKQRAVEADLRRTTEQLQAMADNLPGVVYEFVVAPDGWRLAYMSDSVERIVGEPVMPLDSLFGRLVARIVPEDQPEFLASIERSVAAGTPWECEARLHTAHGTTIVFRGHAEPRAVGRAVVYDGILLDITDQRTAEQAARDHQEERERLTEQLQQSQKMESVGRLAGGVAHDFNNLLTVINGYSDLLLADVNPADPMHESLEQIRKAGGRAASLTQRLLAFSRKQVLKPRVLNLDRILGDLQPMLERLVGEDVDVRLALGAPAATVNADPHQLEQVVLNLVVNARDAMPSGGRLVIETTDVAAAHLPSGLPSAAHGCVCLTVSDSGVGMDEATRQQMFEPFFTTKGAGKGTGLGLSMVHGIVAQSGGTIAVETTPGAGTAIRIFLPKVARAAQDDADPALNRPALGGHETVLIVEDQAEVRNYAAAALRAYGYTVITAENAGEAMLISERRGVALDLLLTDVVMPYMSGRELSERLLPASPGLRVLYMSGYTDDVVVHHGVQEARVGFIQKPFSPQQLATAVRDALGRAPQSPPQA